MRDDPSAPPEAQGVMSAGPRLSRELTLWDLIVYGLVIIQPTAPLPLFGVVDTVAKGHVATTVLIAMFAMMLTAVSYGRMARAYPSAGSAYVFAGRELNAGAGFLTGWCMILDYLLNPAIGVIFCSRAAMNIVPLPFVLWAVLFAGLFTAMNVRSIRASSRTNLILAAGLAAVILAFFASAVRFLIRGHGVGGLFSLQPFYDPKTFSWPLVSTGASIAVLTYMGFDTVSTLSEEAKNPRRNVLLATVLVCFIAGVLGCAEVYLGQLVMPDYASFPNQETAFASVARRAGGWMMFHIVNFALLVATIGSSAGAQTGAVRLLYAMGRDGVIPRRFFGYLHPRRRVPTRNAWLTGGIALLGALSITYESGIELVNFGAFVAFMTVNLAALTRYYIRAEDRGFRQLLVNLAPPLLGFLVCLYIWWSLRPSAKLAGFCWLLAGMGYAVWRTNHFRRRLSLPDLRLEE